MFWIWFELLEFAFKFFESSLKGSNLRSNGSNLVRMVRIYIWMLRIPFEWLGEASWSQIKSLCADLETAWVEIDQKKETLAELEEVVDVQRETLENAHKDLTTEQKKKESITRECKEKDEEFEKLSDFCKFLKKKLQQTQEILLVAREEIS